MMKFVVAILILFIIFACDFKHEVKYTADCTSGTVDLTIANEDEGTAQYTDVPTPWKYEFEAQKDQFLYVSAQNNQDNGTVTVKIYINDDLYKKASSTGAYVIATAYGSVE